ncbi:MAG TPA: dihydrofolate reductase family protein [Ktedonobacterales bacterium]|jgi:riboflavin biosynthesis pyrimidine reductase
MKPIKTLFEALPQSSAAFPAQLAALYDGGLTLTPPDNRPLVLANFVSTIDGVVSYALPGRSGGGEIGGFNEPDACIMGLLRAHSDAVLTGASSFNADSGHVRTPGFVYPPARELYARLRASLGKTRPEPMTVIISASGQVNLHEANLHTPGVETLIITTDAGAERLRAQPGVSAVTYIRSVGAGPELAPEQIVRLLGEDFGLKVLLNEGGPGLFSSFLKARRVDQLFLTLAPQLAGRDPAHQRPALVSQHAFLPEDAPWSQLFSLKQSGDHLFLRYGLAARDTSS